MKKINIAIVLLFTCAFVYSQNTITGTFSSLANQEIKLVGFKGLNVHIIDSVKTDEKGAFNLSYSKEDYGMGYLLTQDQTFIVILAKNELLKLRGKSLALPESIVILNGKQNQLFEQYASEHPRREQTLSAWNYLTKVYRKDSLFAIHKSAQKAIEKEKQRIIIEDSTFLAGLPNDSYVSWYLPIRKLVSSVASIAQYEPEKIPSTIHAFRTLDYTDTRLYKSGLLKKTIKSHFWLIENSGLSMDSVYIEMNKSIDILIGGLLTDAHKLNEVTKCLFTVLEKRSLFRASEYLALTLLNDHADIINNDFSAQLESYRAMKIGNTAPDIEFDGDIFAPSYKKRPNKLSTLNSGYTVVVFGSSWCPYCPSALMQIAGLYKKWNKHDVEVVFVSLDENKAIFKKFVKPFPFISICDYQKWENAAVKNYHVFSTPFIYLLDNNREILLRPDSVDQLNAWIDWYLVQGNK